MRLSPLNQLYAYIISTIAHWNVQNITHWLPCTLSVASQIPLLPFVTVESLLLDSGSATPFECSLAVFCAWAFQNPELSEAPVRQVLCNRQGVHEFILLSCEVKIATQDVVTLWLRIERRPSSQGVGVLLNKPKPAMDTVNASTNLQALREPCESRDSFIYNSHEKPREVLKLKHISEMCRYFTGHSIEYSLLGANCRWICYALLECLREVRPCYGGTWFPSRNERPTADVRAAQLAKSHYLQDKHASCCGRQYLVCPNLGTQITRATVGLASIAITNSGQNARNRRSQCGADQGVIYRAPRSLPDSAVPGQRPSTLATNGGRNFGTATAPQPFSANAASPNNTAYLNSSGLPLGVSATQLDRHQNNISPLPEGGNLVQNSQSSSRSMSEGTISDSPQQHTTTTPPVNPTVSPPSGTSTIPHCSGCQCTSHPSQPQNVSNYPRPEPTHSQPPPIREDNVYDMALRLSSMDIRSGAPVPEAIQGEWVGEDVPVPKEPSKTSAGHQCLGCCSQGKVQARPPPLAPTAPLVPNANRSSFDTPRARYMGRIHSGSTQRPASLFPSAGTTQHNNTQPMTVQHSSYHNNCLTHTSPRTSKLPVSAPRTQSVIDDSNIFNATASHHRHTRFPSSRPASSMMGVAPSCAAHHNRTSSSGAGWLGYDPQTSTHMQECQHLHNHPPPGRFPRSSCSAPHNCSFSHDNDVPQTLHLHEVPSIPPTSQGFRANSQRYSTGDSYTALGRCTYGPSPSLLRNSVNWSDFYQSQEPCDHTYVPPSPIRHNGNMPVEFGHSTQPNLYSIPEGESKSEFYNQWGLGSGSMIIDPSSGYGVQPIVSSHAQPPSSSNPPVHVTPGYAQPQYSDNTLPQSYAPSGLPTGPYSQLEPPSRQWTHEVWGNQEFALPLRTDSPKSLESPLTDGVFSGSQEPATFTRMPDPRDYV